jgi:hypothetical protein
MCGAHEFPCPLFAGRRICVHFIGTEENPMTDAEVLDKIRASEKFIRRKVLQIIRRQRAIRLDPDDTLQDVYLRILTRRGTLALETTQWETALSTICEQAVANIIRDHLAAKRDRRRIASLNVAVETADEGRVEFAEMIEQDGHDARLGIRTRSDHEAADLSRDLATMLAKQSTSIRELAEGSKTMSPSELEVETGIPRSTIRGRMRALRGSFEQAGLREYFLN